MREATFAGSGLPGLFELLAPQALDVQTDGRLVRLERHQGEYWLLMLMLEGLKTQWSQCVTRRLEPYRYLSSFFADQLHDVLQELPTWLWPETRRKRTYINQVLARAEVHSSYEPARRLWVRTKNGHYFPNPEMQLRTLASEGEGWKPVYEQLALAWIDRGCGREIDRRPRPAESIQWVREALARAAEPEPPPADPDGQQRLSREATASRLAEHLRTQPLPGRRACDNGVVSNDRACKAIMNRADVLQQLASSKAELARRYGVIRLALFGSVARGSARPDSDVDILVAFDGPATSSRYFGVQFFLEDLLGCRVDLVTDKALRAELRPYVEREAVHV